MSTVRHVGGWSVAGVVWLVMIGEARGSDAPSVGTTQTLPVVSVSVAVGSTDREVRRVVYAPPPGWYIRSHRVVAAGKHGSVCYAVNTVPAGWNWSADEQATASGKSSAGGAVSAYKVSVGGQFAAAQDSSTAGRQATTSSHHLLVVDVSARGAGLWMGGSGVELTVYAEMVYVGK